MFQGNTANIFETNSPVMKKLLAKLDLVLASKTTAPILILGESGTGKEQLAKYIASKLKKKLVAVNMAGIPHETAESELFGHKQGAFTGATSDKVGLIEQAHNGIFFLDELGDCSPSIQAKLLRVIQEQEILPVGGVVPKKINVRFIAATNKNLNQMVAANSFRLDLYQRLNTFPFKIPALRERPEDVEFYSRKFISEISNSENFYIREDGLEVFRNYHWEGNVRELKSIIERVVVFSKGNCLNRESAQMAVNFNDEEEIELPKFSKEEMINSLHLADGNRTKAAKILGVSRATFYRWASQLDVRTILPKKAGRPSRMQFASNL